jgi:hypothetical protein
VGIRAHDTAARGGDARLGATRLLAAILAGHALLAWQLRSRGIFTFGDDAAYLLLGRALRAFSYREMQFVGEPIAARFPPGYPGLLAILGSLFGERLDVIAVAGIVLSASGIWALFDVVRRRWSTETALAAAALVAINPALSSYAAVPASETMFTTLVLWSLWAADRMDATRGSAGSGRGNAALAIALGIGAALTRSAGLTLPLALFAHWVWRRRWRAAVVAGALTTLFVGGWLAWTTVAPRRDVRLSYIDDAVRPAGGEESFARTLANRLAANVPAYAGQVSLSQLPVPITGRTIADNVGWVVLLGGLFLVGALSAWRRWHAALTYVLAYCALLAVWPYLLDRFLTPMMPFALTFIVIGAAALGERLWRRDVAVVAVTGLLAAFALLADARLVAAADACDRSRVDCAPAISLDFVEAARRAGSMTPENARFVAPKGGTLFYHGQRQAVFWEEVVRQDTASFVPFLRATGVTHILATPVYADYRTLLGLVAHSCSQFELVHSVSRYTFLLAFRGPDATAEGGARACGAVRRVLGPAHVPHAGPPPEPSPSSSGAADGRP